jgi:SAM-dependent methyltransferase
VLRQKPPSELARSGGYRQREKVGRVWRRLLAKEGRLPRDGAVLDVGCGLGRMAAPLVNYFRGKGRYEGLDVEEDAIRWCRQHIGADHPNFRFTLAGVHSLRYNPEGESAPATFRFPYEDAAFDTAFLASVFTHLLPDAVARYLRELARVLKPGGRCLATYFLLNQRSERAITEGEVKELHRFPHRLDGCRVLSLELPESAVAHDEARIRHLYAESGLTILEPVSYGRWTGADSRLNQDLIVAEKAARGGDS